MAGRDVVLARLAYELQLETKGFSQALTQTERQLGQTASFIKAHPVAAAGALAASLVAVGAKATEMAAEVDAGLRKIGTNLPEVVGRIDELKGTVKDLSLEFGLAQTDIVAAMDAIAAGGVESTDDLIARTRAVAKVVTATGAEVGTVVGLLDDTLDSFKLAGADSEKVLAKLLATAKGKVSLQELAEIMKTIGPLARASGVDFDTLTAAAVKLADQNIKGKRAIGDLTKLLEAEGKAGMERYAESAKVASDGMAELNEQVNVNLATTEKQAAILKAQLNAVLIDLGKTTLPLVIKGMQALTGLISILTGELNEIPKSAAQATIESLAGSIGKLNDEAKKTEALDRLQKATEQLANGGRAAAGSIRGIDTAIRAHLRDRTPKELEVIRDGLQAIITAGGHSAGELERLQGSLARVTSEIEKRPFKALGEDAAGAAGGIRKLSDAEREAVQQSKTLLAGQKELILSSTDLTGEQLKLVAQAVKEMGKSTTAAGKEATEAAEKHAAALEKIRNATIASTVTLVDDTELAIEKLTQELQQAGVGAEDVARGIQPLNDQLRLIRVNEQFKLPEILAKSAKALSGMEVAKLKDARTELAALYATTLAGTKEHEEIGRRLAEVDGKIVEHNRATSGLTKEINERLEVAVKRAKELGVAAFEIPKPLKTTNERITEIGREVAIVARGAVGLAQGFGLVNSEAAAVLHNIISIGENLGKALGGDPAALVGVIGGLAGAIAGLFGESAESKAHKQLLATNNERLRELRDGLGDILQLSLPGAKAASIEAALQEFLQLRGSRLGDGNKANAFELGKILFGQGVDRADLARVAEGLGIQITNKETGKLDLSGLRQLLQALQSAEFTRFGENFADQMERIRTFLETGLLDAEQEFAAIAEVLKRQKSASPAITKALEGFDVSTTEGRAGALESLRNLLRRTESGEEIPKADLGALTGPEFLRVLSQLIGILSSDAVLKGLDSSGLPLSEEDSPVAASAAVVGALEAQGSVEADYFSNALALDQRQVDLLDGILASLEGFTPVAPPSIPFDVVAGTSRVTAGASSGPTVSLTIEALNITAPVSDAAGLAEALSPVLLEQIRRGLASLALNDRLGVGNASR